MTTHRLATVVRGNRAADCDSYTLWLCQVLRPGLVGARVYGPGDPVWISEGCLGRATTRPR